jgi:hypothetical protein
MLGFTEDSAKVPLHCSPGEAVYPWRWGLGRPLQPGETRTISGYVRFRTPGTYKLRANLVQEWIKYDGVDGAGTAVNLGALTVTPAKIYSTGHSLVTSLLEHCWNADVKTPDGCNDFGSFHKPDHRT